MWLCVPACRERESAKKTKETKTNGYVCQKKKKHNIQIYLNQESNSEWVKFFKKCKFLMAQSYISHSACSTERDMSKNLWQKVNRKLLNANTNSTAANEREIKPKRNKLRSHLSCCVCVCVCLLPLHIPMAHSITFT